MNRRDSMLSLLALGAAPLVARAQQSRVFRVGVIMLGGPYAGAVGGLRDGLKALGLEDGKHFVFHVRDLKGDLKLVEAAASDVEREHVDLIYSLSTSLSVRVKRATKNVPIVFYVGNDPVVAGLVDNFRRPGGRLTGIHGQFVALAAKRLELLKVLVPSVRRIVTFYDPGNPTAQRSVKITRDAAQQLNIELVDRPVASVEELRAGLLALRPGDADAFFWVSDAMVTSQSDFIVETAKAKKLPTMFQEQGSVANGGFASYGESYHTIGRLSAKYVQQILKGEVPGNLPIEQTDRLHFVINVRTAKALGVNIPQSVLMRADEVIQ